MINNKNRTKGMLNEAADTRAKKCLCMIARAKEKPFMTDVESKTIKRLLFSPAAWRRYTVLEGADIETVFNRLCKQQNII